MTLREEAAFVLEQVPDFKLSELIHFMYFLRDCPNSMGMSDKPKGRPRDLRGFLKGKIFITDDFNESMELVTASELRELREKAEARQQEAVV